MLRILSWFIPVANVSDNRTWLESTRKHGLHPGFMITRDFILRQIQQLIAVLTRVLLLRNTGQHEEILHEVRLGLSNNELGAALHDTVDRTDLLDLCKSGSDFSFEKALALADLLREKGFAEKQLGHDNWPYSLLHALWLYEHIDSLPNSIKPLDMSQRIAALREDIGSFTE